MSKPVPYTQPSISAQKLQVDGGHRGGEEEIKNPKTDSSKTRNSFKGDGIV